MPYNEANKKIHLMRLSPRSKNFIFMERAVWEIEEDPYLTHETSVSALQKKQSFEFITSGHRKLVSIKKEMTLEIVPSTFITLKLFNFL